MTIYRYGADGLMSFNLTEDELLMAYYEQRQQIDEDDVIDSLQSNGHDDIAQILMSKYILLKQTARNYRDKVEADAFCGIPVDEVIEALPVEVLERMSA